MNLRLKKLKSLLKENGLDAFLVSKDVNIVYLTDFPASDSWLFVTRNQVFYITDFRYIYEAKGRLKGITVKQYSQSIFTFLTEIAKKNNVKRIGFNDKHMVVRFLHECKKVGGKEVRWFPKSDFVENLRLIKEKNEIVKIKKAVKLNLKAFNYVKRLLRPGITEKNVQHHLAQFVKNHHVAFSFDPIVAFGVNSCYPHAKITDKRLRKGEPVLIDMGIDFRGLKSDLTRMFFLGKIPRLIEEIYSFVYAAQRVAINKIRPGIQASEIDKAARDSLRKHKLDKLFGHSLGHGVGLEIHEGPTISSASSDILQEGMVCTVEPAVYYPGKFGVRIEDMVLVTKKGCEVLSDNID